MKIPDLRKATVTEFLAKKSLPDKVRRCLEIRQSLSKSSTAKFKAMLGREHNNRICDTLMYHGASTGRWTARGIQPQNLPRGSFKDVDFCIELIKQKDANGIEMLFGDLMDSISTCIRAAICAPEGSVLICADFSSIEARVLAWLADEQKVLDSFVSGLDLYKVAATSIYGKNYEEITKAERQIGKVSVLALGYQGGVGAFQAMANGYGVKVDNDVAQGIVDSWRNGHQKIKQFWWNTEKAAVDAVEKGEACRVGKTIWATVNNFLHCRLPSGRVLSYYKPYLEMTLTPWKKMKNVLHFTGVDTYSKKWSDQTTYGGKLVENVCQAVARDFMAEAMLRVEKAGYKTVLTVHDEIVVEMEEGKGSLEELENLMSVVPEWGLGCPIEAEGWIGKRYRK